MKLSRKQQYLSTLGYSFYEMEIIIQHLTKYEILSASKKDLDKLLQNLKEIK